MCNSLCEKDHNQAEAGGSVKIIEKFLARGFDTINNVAIPVFPEIDDNQSERLISIDSITPWINSVKAGFLAPFLELQQKLEKNGVIPRQPRNTKLYEYSDGEIKAIESGEMIGRVHVIADMRCNHNCVHCSRGVLASEMSMGEARLLRVHREHNTEITKHGVMIPTEDLVNLINEGSKLGPSGYPKLRELSLDGGEPLLYWNRIEPLLNALEKVNEGRDPDKMMRLQIYTNGSTLTEQQIDKLASLPFTYLTVNYIARDKKVFDWFTDTPGSYEKVSANLEALVEAGKKHGRDRWLMAALVPLEENKHVLMPTIDYLWAHDIVPIVQPMRVKERGEANVERDIVHPLSIQDHLRFLVDCWIWSLKKYVEDPNTSETKGWLWRIDEIFPPNDPSLKKRRDPLRYPFEYTAFIKLFKENRPSYQMLMRWVNHKIDWSFGEYGTVVVEGERHFSEIGHDWNELYDRHRRGLLRYNLSEATTLAKSDYPVKHGNSDRPPANLGEKVTR